MATLIAVEGPDKVGKATQSELLVRALRKSGVSAVSVEVPVKGGATHKLIYRMLHSGWAKRLPNLFQFVQFLNKLAFQLFSLPAYERLFDVVVFDRWALSSIVYGNASGANRRLNALLYWLLKKPAMTLVLFGPPFKRGADDSYEADASLQRAVSSGYVRWALDHSSDHRVIDNRGDRSAVHEAIVEALAEARVVDARSSL